LLVIDVTVAFCGEYPEPITESIKKWRNSCGEEAWRAVDVIAGLTSTARDSGVPVIYSAGTPAPPLALYSGRWAQKNLRRSEDSDEKKRKGYEVVEPIAPTADDILIRKTKPSAFFGTPLLSYLIELGIDTLVCCGTSTSGCVRATVVDAFSHNYRVAVVEEATFDRTQSSHAINLYDMAQKYADVVTTDAALAATDQIGPTTSDAEGED
jgi:nicotinamidase-related amidase